MFDLATPGELKQTVRVDARILDFFGGEVAVVRSCKLGEAVVEGSWHGQPRSASFLQNLTASRSKVTPTSRARRMPSGVPFLLSSESFCISS
jgi:hypothetical protein